MRASAYLAAIIPALVAQAARIVQSNDDGWAELYLRSFNDALNEAGHDVVLSAPADNQSGTGMCFSPLLRAILTASMTTCICSYACSVHHMHISQYQPIN